jgi:hypothetical protein
MFMSMRCRTPKLANQEPKRILPVVPFRILMIEDRKPASSQS